jgi:uncharacterized repeat protein (TIGR01451 family)
LFGPGVTPDATDSNAAYSDTVIVNGDGSYSTSGGSNPGGYLPTMAGTYEWLAVYSGDANNPSVNSGFGNEPEAVNFPQQTSQVTVSKTADQPSIDAGQAAGFTITISNIGAADAQGLTLSDPPPAGAGNDVNWQIDTSGAGFGAGTQPADFIITGPVGQQTLNLSGSVSTLAAVGRLSVHVVGQTTASDLGTLRNTATVNASNEPAFDQNAQATASVSVLGPLNFTSAGGLVTLTDTNGILQVVVQGKVVASAALANISSVTITGATGVENAFKIDYSQGTFFVPGGITFNGGALPGTPSNSLTIDGGSFDQEVFHYSDAHDGSVDLLIGGQVVQTVTYTNLTPLDITSSARNVVFDLPDGSVVATLDATAGNVELISDNGTFETTTIAVPSGSLTINAGSGATIAVTNNFHQAFSGTLNVQGGAAATRAANLLVLDPKGDRTLNASGGGQVQLTGGATATVDSSGRQSVAASGHASISGSEIDVAGSPGYDADGKASIQATILPNSPPLADPFAGLVVPQQPIASSKPINVDHGSRTLTPGTYVGGIKVGGNASVSLAPGVYFILGGGISVSGHASLSGAGVFIYDSAAGHDPDGIEISGDAVVKLTAGSSGPFHALALMQAAGNKQRFDVSGNARLDLTGAIDAAGATMTVSGMAQANIQSDIADGLIGQVIVDQLNVSGHAQLVIDAGQPTPSNAGPLHQALISAAAVTASDPTASDPAPPSATPNQLYVQAVYQDLLGRAVDAGALAFWAGQLDQGLSRAAFVNAIDHSPEYFATLVQPLYQQYLGRVADPAGLTWWAAQLAAGMSDAQLQAGFIGSAEFYQDAGGTAVDWVDALYEALLDRPADAQGEAYWASQLAQGVDRASIVYGFTSSPEQAQQWLADQYAQYLGRTADSSGLSAGATAMANGMTNEQVLSLLLASDEYFNLYAGE